MPEEKKIYTLQLDGPQQLGVLSAMSILAQAQLSGNNKHVSIAMIQMILNFEDAKAVITKIDKLCTVGLEHVEAMKKEASSHGA